MQKAVLFDLDGTLLDTGKGIIKSVEYTINQMGLHELSETELESFVGPPIKNKLISLFSLSESAAIMGMNIFRSHYAEGDIYMAEVYDGILELLKSLRNHGFKLGVATYKREDQAINLLHNKKIDMFFDVVHGSDLAGQMSKADVVRLCINDLKCLPEEVVMIGDSDNDAIGAATVGCQFIGVTYGYGFKNESEVQKFSCIGSTATPGGIMSLILDSI